MHVVIITDFAIGNGGAGRVAVDSACALTEAGVSVTFIHAIEGADEALARHSIVRHCLGLQDVWNLGAAKAAQAGIWNSRAAHMLDDILRPFRGKEDTVLHLHQWTRALSPSIFPVLTRTMLPVVATVSDYFLACPNGVFFRFERNAPCALAPLSASCVTTNCDTKSYAHKTVRVLRLALAQHHLRQFPLHLIHVSDHARDKIAPVVPASWRHHRIDNPVSIARAPPTTIVQDAKFAYVGRLLPEKGAVVAAAAAARAKAPIIFIGDGPAAAEIRTLCPAAEITGWLAPQDVFAILRDRAKTVLAPTLLPEPGPLTVYEAAAMGLPSIVSDRCGASERVSSASGIVVAPTVDGFASAMTRLADDNLVRSMGRTAYDHYWADPLTVQTHARRLIGLYRSVCPRFGEPQHPSGFAMAQ